MSAITNRDRTIDAQTLFFGAMELGNETRQPLMTDAELRNPLPYLLLNQVVPPLIKDAIPEEVRGPIEDGIREFFANRGRAGSSRRGNAGT